MLRRGPGRPRHVSVEEEAAPREIRKRQRAADVVSSPQMDMDPKATPSERVHEAAASVSACSSESAPAAVPKPPTNSGPSESAAPPAKAQPVPPVQNPFKRHKALSP